MDGMERFLVGLVMVVVVVVVVMFTTTASCVYDAYLKPSSTVAAASGSIIAPRMS
jgi:hypothetical protein